MDSSISHKVCALKQNLIKYALLLKGRMKGLYFYNAIASTLHLFHDVLRPANGSEYP